MRKIVVLMFLVGACNAEFPQSGRDAADVAVADMAQPADAAPVRTTPPPPDGGGRPAGRTTTGNGGSTMGSGKSTSDPLHGLGDVLGKLLGNIIDKASGKDKDKDKDKPKTGTGGSGGSGGTGTIGGNGAYTECPADLDFYGYCYNNSAIWCDGDAGALADDCGGKTCSYSCKGHTGYAWCCPASEIESDTTQNGGGTTTTNNCGGLTDVGDCTPDGQVVWCENGNLKYLNCTLNTDNGYTGCGFVDAGYYDCVYPEYSNNPTQNGGGNTSQNGDCGDLTYQGECTDGVNIRYCDNGVVKTVSCGDNDSSCYYANDDDGYLCY